MSYEQAETLNQSWLSNDHNVKGFGRHDVCVNYELNNGETKITFFVFNKNTKEEALEAIWKEHPKYLDADTEVFM